MFPSCDTLERQVIALDSVVAAIVEPLAVELSKDDSGCPRLVL